MHTHPAPAEFPQAAGISSTWGVPCWPLHPHCCLFRATWQLMSHALLSLSVFLIPGHGKNSGLLPSASLKEASWAKHILGVLHTLSAFTIPLSLLGQVLCSFFYSLTVRLNKEPTSTCHFLRPHLDHHTKNVSFRRKILSLPLVSH